MADIYAYCIASVNAFRIVELCIVQAMAEDAEQVAERLRMADRLKTARALAGLKGPTEAARKLRMRAPTYLAHENGSRGFKRSAALKYARAFQVDVEWLLYGFGNPRGPSIMDKFHALSPDGRQHVEKTMDIQLEMESRDRKASRENQ